MIQVEDDKISWSDEPGSTPLSVEVGEDTVKIVMHGDSETMPDRQVVMSSGEFAFLAGAMIGPYVHNDSVGEQFMAGTEQTHTCEHDHAPPGAQEVEEDDEFDIRDHIDIHMVTSGEEQFGWVHTHGMEAFDLPNLEVRGVPLFVAPALAGILNHVTEYMVLAKRQGRDSVKLGERMEVGPYCVFEFVQLPAIPGDEAHFEHPRWALSDAPLRSLCVAEDCNDPSHNHNRLH